MKLLEVVKGASTSAEAIATSMSLGKKIGKTTVLAGNCFGFIGNRMLSPYSYEASFLLEEGASPSQVDKIIKTEFGMAMGPFEVRIQSLCLAKLNDSRSDERFSR
jgi:3-hydroxyacyl-CoA dehydrogenase